jgi:clan AA aspartic protease
MIRWTVSSKLEGFVRLRLRGPADVEVDVDALVDSGFTSSLALPKATIASLGLVHRRSGKGKLADGSIRRFNIFAAELAWDGRWRPVTVYEAGDQTLLGTRLIVGHRLQMDIVPGGTVEITPLS